MMTTFSLGWQVGLGLAVSGKGRKGDDPTPSLPKNEDIIYAHRFHSVQEVRGPAQEQGKLQGTEERANKQMGRTSKQATVLESRGRD